MKKKSKIIQPTIKHFIDMDVRERVDELGYYIEVRGDPLEDLDYCESNRYFVYLKAKLIQYSQYFGSFVNQEDAVNFAEILSIQFGLSVVNNSKKVTVVRKLKKKLTK